jgi:hypothetical protein
MGSWKVSRLHDYTQERILKGCIVNSVQMNNADEQKRCDDPRRNVKVEAGGGKDK